MKTQINNNYNFSEPTNFFYNKRSEADTLLKYEGNKLALKYTDKFFELLTSSNTYKLFTKEFPKEYVDGYFKKLFHYQMLLFSHQIVINDWNSKKIKNYKENKIYLKTIFGEPFIFSKLIPKILENSEKYEFKKISIFIILKKKLFNLLKEICFYTISFIKIFKDINFSKKNKTSIGVTYNEGISENKRSDLFWYYDSKIKNSNIILIIDSPYFLKKYNEKEEINKLQKNPNFKVVKIWENKNFKKNSLFDPIRKGLYKSKNNSVLDAVLLKPSLEFLKQVELWHYFFKKYNIKIHLEHREWSYETVAKQIALDLVNGCSVGRLRSYLTEKPEKHYFFYPYDIFCCWGKKNTENYNKKVLLESEFKPKTILTTGYPYTYTSLKIKTEVQQIKKKFEEKGTKFNVLLIDNVFSKNDNFIEQFIIEEAYIKLYTIFLNWVAEDAEIGLIVKPKKNFLLKDFERLNINFRDSINTGRCHIVEDTYQKEVWHYSEISNFAVSVAIDTMPSALIG